MGLRASVVSALRLLNSRDRRKLVFVTVVQIATSLLDLIGVLLLGLVGALAVTTVQSQPPPNVVEEVVASIGLSDWSSQDLLALFACSAAVILLTKSILSSVLLRRAFLFLASRQAVVSARLTKALLSQPLTFVQQRSSQEVAYALVQGTEAAALLILGQAVVVVSEAALLTLLGVVLLMISPVVAISAIAFFALVAVALQFALGNWASRAGESITSAGIASMDAIQEVIAAYREIIVSDRRALYIDRIQSLRWQAAKVAADLQFIGSLPKYVFEVALVLGGFALAGVLFATQDAIVAVGTLALFLAAATRVMPSLLRLQSAALSMRNAAGIAAPTLALAEALGHPQDVQEPIVGIEELRTRVERGYPDFQPTVELRDITFAYPGEDRAALTDVSLSIPAGSSVAFVGTSGAGKSTLADIVLGVLEPERGLARIGGLPPHVAIQRWPGGIAYVPQDVILANSTIRANVALGLPREAVDDDLVWEALRRASLADSISASLDGLDTLIGERGIRMSGGQRQRLGIARALYARPRLIVLDEATSALDAETELAVGKTIAALEGIVTTCIIAHRLSTVRNVDQIVYLDYGRIAACGSFDQVRRQVPAFDRQAAIMGLA